MERHKLILIFLLCRGINYVVTEAAGSYFQFREHGELCNIWNAPCNSAAYLTCFGGCCRCQNGMIYNPAVRSCTCPSGSSIGNGNCAPKNPHDQRCRHNSHCMTSSGFSCVNGKCACDATISTYDAKHQKCLRLVGASCNGHVQGIACVEGAFCNGAVGTCQCMPGYYLTYGSLCAKQIERGNPCVVDGQCGTDRGSGQALKCVNGICDCDPNTSVFSTFKTNKFVTYDARGMRVANPDQTVSLCAPKDGLPCLTGLEGYCAPGTVCKSGTCRCESGRVDPDGRGKCLLDVGGSCDATNKCVSGLSCVDGSCRCRFEGQEYVNGACRSPVNCPCKKDEECDEQARCVVAPGRSRGHCGPCSPGWSVNKRGFCQILVGHEGFCSGSGQCDDVAGLACIDNKCQCLGHAVFSRQERKCLIVSGCRCGEKPSDKCVPNAICIKTHPDLPGHCNCVNGFTESADYTCEDLSGGGPGNEITKRPVIVVPILPTTSTQATTTTTTTPGTKPTTTITTTTTMRPVVITEKSTTTTTTTTEADYIYGGFDSDEETTTTTTTPSPPPTTTTTTTTTEDYVYTYDKSEEDSSPAPPPVASTTTTEDPDDYFGSDESKPAPTTPPTATEGVDIGSDDFDSFEEVY